MRQLMSVWYSPVPIPSHFSLFGNTHNYSSIPEKVKPSWKDGFMGHGEKLVVLCLQNRKGTHWSTEMSERYRPPIVTILLHSNYCGIFFFSISHIKRIVFHSVRVKSILVNIGQNTARKLESFEWISTVALLECKVEQLLQLFTTAKQYSNTDVID